MPRQAHGNDRAESFDWEICAFGDSFTSRPLSEIWPTPWPHWRTGADVVEETEKWAKVVIEAAREATRTIPTVFVGVSEPISRGYIASLARPGGNITGFTNI